MLPDVRLNDVLARLYDAKIDTVALGGLPSSGVSRMSVGLTAPSSADKWYYRICVDRVDVEKDEDSATDAPSRSGR